ncbi:hypothetical protein KJ751_03000 [Patescibacteria group bacterium]|nr:hypothetical protein [Patescibacteria group bacterium]
MISKFGVILLGICFFDLGATSLGIHFGYLDEMNPLLDYYLVQFGLWGLILSKIFLSVVPVFVIETVNKIGLITKWQLKIYCSIAIFIYVLVLLITAMSLYFQYFQVTIF